jgi:hypothetical protein
VLDAILFVASMKRILVAFVLAILPSVAVSTSVAIAEDLYCPAVMFCDDNGRYYDWVDPLSPCALAQADYCTKLSDQSKAARTRSVRIVRYTKRYSQCISWADRASRRVAADRRAAWAKALKERSCNKYAVRAKKLSAARW